MFKWIRRLWDWLFPSEERAEMARTRTAIANADQWYEEHGFKGEGYREQAMQYDHPVVVATHAGMFSFPWNIRFKIPMKDYASMSVKEALVAMEEDGPPRLKNDPRES